VYPCGPARLEGTSSQEKATADLAPASSLVSMSAEIELAKT